ncbi:MAG TPA: hypothetical protein VGV86_04615 [Acidimicrobiales bacterium]|nr:hypothetical protein [Acidimicrobiales bacterium]
MPSFEVTYRGPSTIAVRAAALLADAEGVELTSATRPDYPTVPEESAVLQLTLMGTAEAVTAALDSVQGELPPGATLMMEAGAGG